MPKVKIDYSSKVYKASSKYIQGKKYFEDLYNSGQLPDCNRGFISGYCGCNTYAKNILCGKEYCKDCGREGSPQHQKRFNRWMPKARALKQFGVLVITIPEEIRYKYLNKIRLSDFRTAIKNKLKRLGCERGLMRWHLFGDCVYCEGKSCAKCEHTGAGSDFKPHLNIVIEKGFIKDINNSELLNDLKNFVTSYWKRAYNKEFIANINYHCKTVAALRELLSAFLLADHIKSVARNPADSLGGGFLGLFEIILNFPLVRYLKL